MAKLTDFATPRPSPRTEENDSAGAKEGPPSRISPAATLAIQHGGELPPPYWTRPRYQPPGYYNIDHMYGVLFTGGGPRCWTVPVQAAAET